jgi:hypothetical protein
MNNITLRIHKVKCVDETGGRFQERFGNDEISLGGFGVDANLTPTKVAPFDVYAHFDDGETKNYSPPLRFVTLDLTGQSEWPKSCGVGFLLFERDNGGRDGATDKVFAEVSKKLEEEKATRGMRFAAIPWAVIATKVWEYIEPWVKQKLRKAIDDDMFPLRIVEVTIPSPDFSWDGSNTSSISTVDFRDHSGIYELTYDWELA